MHSSLTLGIDPAKNKFTACLLDAEGRPAMKSKDYAADREGFEALTKDLRAHRASGARLVIGVEASAAYDDNLLAHLARPEFRRDGPATTIRVDAAQVARFEGARPVRGKTDSADARRIAVFARTHGAQLDAFEHDEKVLALVRMIGERGGLVEDVSRMCNRLQDRLVTAFPEFASVMRNPCGDLALAVLRVAATAAECARKRPATLARIRPRKGAHSLGGKRAAALAEKARSSVASGNASSDAAAIRHLCTCIALHRERIAEIHAELDAFASTALATATPADGAPAPMTEAEPVPEVPVLASPTVFAPPAADVDLLAAPPVLETSARVGEARPERARPNIAAQILLAASLPGIARLAAAILVLRCRGLLRFVSAKALAAQLACHPSRKQTGSSRDSATLSFRGDRQTRSILYLAALAACQCDVAFAFHRWRMVQSGLKPRQAVCACMNRLVHVLFAVVSSNTPYDPARAVRVAKAQHPELWKRFVAEQLPKIRASKEAKKLAAAA